MSEAHAVGFDAPGADGLAVDDALWTLYEDSFPDEEREPRSVILTSVAAGHALLARARLGQSTCGLAVAHLLTRPPTAFLVYLAVSPGHRGHGLGTRLFEYVWNLSKSHSSARGMELEGVVWEIDVPDRAATDHERTRRLRRRDFFARLGGRVLTASYLQPPVNGPAPVPMILMYRAALDGHVPRIDDLVRAIYFEKYASANGIPADLLNGLLTQVVAT